MILDSTLGEIELKYPRLYELFGAYINQDLFFEYDSLEAALADYVNHSDSKQLTDVSIELETILSKDDATLEDFVGVINKGYVFQEDGRCPRSWLEWLREHLK